MFIFYSIYFLGIFYIDKHDYKYIRISQKVGIHLWSVERSCIWQNHVEELRQLSFCWSSNAACIVSQMSPVYFFIYFF